MRQRSRLQILVVMACVLAGCASIGANTSGGGTVRSTQSPGPAATIYEFSYHNTIGFSGDLTGPVDIVAARLRQKDPDIQAMLTGFLEPGYDLLADKYKIVLVRSTPAADARARLFSVSTPIGEWTEQLLPDRTPLSNLLIAPSLFRDSVPSPFRWRASISSANATFNSLTPTKVTIDARLRIEFQRQTASGIWGPVRLDEDRTVVLERMLRNDLNNAYYAYLRDKFDMRPTFPGFSGANEK